MLLGRVYRIFRRYADIHVALDLPAPVLRDAEGREFGRIERISLRRGRILVEGWAEARRIGLRMGRVLQWTAPDLVRPGSAQRGFALDVPFEAGPIEILAERDPAPVSQALAGFSPRRVELARLRLSGRFLRTLAALAPEIHRWKRRGDLGAREVVKERLGLVPRSDAAVMDAALLAPVPAPAPRMATIVMPVHNAFDVLQEALERVARHSGRHWRMLLIEDGSTDPAVRPFVEDWCAAQGDHVTLMVNPRNLGFIGSVNRGFEAARRWPDDPVVLLNSDALVAEGWLPRLLAPLADPDVASVTPLSNDAEIFTLPVICARDQLDPGMGDALAAAAARLGPAAGNVDAPTGVGFCMAMAPRFLEKLPAFDPVFGRGYGEETDWCQKARALGGRHVCAADVFVEHRGGQSFGSVDKQRLLERNLAEISRRYPAYDGEVQDFIRRDPLTTPRLALALVWAAHQQDWPVSVYLAHAMGGGAEAWLGRHIRREIEGGGSAVVLRVGQGHRWKVELHCGHGVTSGLTNDVRLVETLIGLIPRRRIVYSCGVNDRDPIALPGLLLRLAGQEGGGAPAHPVEMLFHDFFPISPSYTLLGQDGVYRGVPLPGGAPGADAAHRAERPGGEQVDLARWQAEWGRLMQAAGQVTVFSESSRDIVATAWPQVAGAIRVVPHRLHAAPPRIAPGGDGAGPPVIGVLGNIGYQKGAALLQRLSRDLARSRAAGLAVIGHVDPAWRLAAPARVHGNYELRDLPLLVARYRISCWLIPSIWPETFSFTTHEALATGLPVFAFDLGAQGDAVARAVQAGAPGAVLPLPAGHVLDPSEMLRILGETAQRARAETEPT